MSSVLPHLSFLQNGPGEDGSGTGRPGPYTFGSEQGLGLVVELSLRSPSSLSPCCLLTNILSPPTAPQRALGV